MEERLNKIQKIATIALVLSIISLLFSVIPMFSIKEEKAEENNTATEETNTYDVSLFKSLDTQGVLDLFNDKKGTYVVYLGRSTCSACESFLPTLKVMQIKYDYITQYLDVTTVDGKSDAFNKLMDKLSKEVTITVEGKEVTQSYGDFFGYTPMTFVIKNGKFVNGIVGAYSQEKFEAFLNSCGIK